MKDDQRKGGSFWWFKVGKLVRSLKHVLVLPCVLSLSVMVLGCATIIHGSNQEIVVNSWPPGAKVLINNQDTHLTTPAIVRVKREDSPVLLRVEKEGYKPAMVALKRSLSGWVLGNCCLGYGVFPGAIIDDATGAAFRISPKTVFVRFPKTSETPIVIAPVPNRLDHQGNMITEGEIKTNMRIGYRTGMTLGVAGIGLLAGKFSERTNFIGTATLIGTVIVHALGKRIDRQRVIDKIKTQRRQQKTLTLNEQEKAK